ncbi:scopoletin glucosyltransferase-like [Asparagus officinalis]|uniref:scopoletin glucosyltransferase-like n=1 Tax=Asparagus officinalis TaxID=4686 RepID=UPI00098DE1B9|nr:scopoletin glucosyltransferase-like [Asparagus officinalis]
MGTEDQRPLHIFFLPLMSPGHMIPMVDMAKLFALRPNISATIITTPANEPLVRPSIQSTAIELLLVPFPHSVTHLLRDGNENLASLTFPDFRDFFIAFYSLQKPIEELLYSRRPDCIVSDFMFTWTTDTAAALNVPRIVFYGHGTFANCVHESLLRYTPYEKVNDDSEVFAVEGLPHRIEMTRLEVSLGLKYSTQAMVESVERSYGVVVNSFVELEPEYAELYRKNGRRAYYVGPLSLSTKDEAEKADRGKKFNPELEGLITWLDKEEENSAVYACFGSLNEFSAAQLREIALGLEASGQLFVWAVRDINRQNEAEWLPEDFEERVKGKGVVIRGWAPQIAILNHRAVGGFLTHCGWNSTLESISAGVPMVTWPVDYEQFVNEKLVAQVLDIGVSIEREGKKVVKAKEIAKAVKNVMGEGEEAEERRMRARKYAVKARAAMEESSGSSYLEMNRMIEEIREHSHRTANI